MGRYWRPAGAAIPAVFFILVASLTAFAAGPDTVLLARIGKGALWIAALLAALLPVGTLLAGDAEDGTLDQLRVAGVSLEGYAAARLMSHWLGFAPAILIAALAGSVLLGIDAESALLRLLAGTPALAALGVVAAALVAGARNGEALAGLIVLPLALPLLIFGAGEGEAALRLLLAASLLITAAAPFAAAAALRIMGE